MKKLPHTGALILFSSQAVNAALSTLVGLVLLRMMTVSDFGRFSAVLALAQILAGCVDSGMGQFVAKEIARSSAYIAAELNQILTWRLLMIAVVCALAPLLARLFLPASYGPLALAVIPAVQLLVMTDFFCWIYKGARRPAFCALLQILAPALLLALCVIALTRERQLFYVVAAHAAAGGLAVALGLWLVSRSLYALRLTALPRSFFTQTLPTIYKLGGILVLTMAFSRVDILMVAHICGTVQAGLFGSVGRVLDGLRMIPTAAYGICLPIFSAVSREPQVLRQKFKAAYLLLLGLALFFCLTGFVCGEWLFVQILGPQYAASVPFFKPLVWSGVFMFSNILMFAIFYVLGNHRTPALGMAAGLGIEIVINALFLDRYGTMAAVWARLIAEGVIFSVYAREILRRDILGAGDLILRPGLVIGVCLAVLGFTQEWPPAWRWVAGIAAVGTLAALFYPVGTLLRREWSDLKNAFL